MSSAAAPRVVALGGGHGLAATLSALVRLEVAITAVVSVADDGGSSGRLRRERGALPPGDLRMALSALARRGPWPDTFAHRFDGAGSLAGHPVGNLVLTGLVEVLGDPVQALHVAGELLGARGQVLPLCVQPVDMVATVVGLDPADPDTHHQVRGQVAVATTTGRVVSLRLEPEDPPACPQAVAAIEAADWVVLGPGSLYSSQLPHLLVPEVRRALARRSTGVAYVLNLAPQPGETEGFSPEAHLEVLAVHAPEIELTTVVADAAAVPDVASLRRCAGSLGAELLLADLRAPEQPDQHDPARLAHTLAGVMGARPAADGAR